MLETIANVMIPGSYQIIKAYRTAIKPQTAVTHLIPFVPLTSKTALKDRNPTFPFEPSTRDMYTLKQTRKRQRYKLGTSLLVLLSFKAFFFSLLVIHHRVGGFQLCVLLVHGATFVMWF